MLAYFTDFMYTKQITNIVMWHKKRLKKNVKVPYNNRIMHLLVDKKHFQKTTITQKYYKLKLFQLQDLKNLHSNIYDGLVFSNLLTL